MLCFWLAAASSALLAPPLRAPPRPSVGVASGGAAAAGCSHAGGAAPTDGPLVLRITQQRASRSSRARLVRMQEAPFWQNVERFARFFISSVAGLILTILSPFAAFSRSPALAGVGAALFLGLLVFIYGTLTAMQAPLPVAAPTLTSLPPEVDPSMQAMLKDIYGP